ncbi:Zinc finger BED-type protein [Dioscorea alata]|uniref:Zinc finger BED-type protein n=1 Tax=Dioscorea alata TaxID=55571 RepID=A0ACB7VW58_DIOAL|nr:Zinc finger BED-type protein [Dioscorea alata]
MYPMAENESSGASNSMASSDNSLKRNSSDVGWEFAILVDPTNLDKLKCKFCMKVVSGGIYRMKQHIVNIKGNVSSCSMCTEDAKAKCKAAIEEAKIKKQDKNRHELEKRKEVYITMIDEEDYEDVEVGGSMKRPRVGGLMDRFTSSINHWVCLCGNKIFKMLLIRIEDMMCIDFWQDESMRWVFLFNAIDKDIFIQFVEAVGIYGKGYRPPSQYELKEPLLKEEVKRTKGIIRDHEKEWENNGCSIMCQF